MRREAQNLLLAVLGGTIVKLALDGGHLRYVKPSLQPFLLVSGLAIVLLALVAIARDIRRGRALEAAHGESSRPYWMLFAVTGMILFLAPPALNAAAVRTAAPDEVIAAQVAPEPEPDDETLLFPPLPAGVPELTMGEILERAYVGPSGGLDDRRIVVAGFVVRSAGGKGDDLARLYINCCAADARTLRLHLRGELPPGVEEDDWLSVTGRIISAGDSSDPARWPTLAVDDARRIPEPRTPYGY